MRRIRPWMIPMAIGIAIGAVATLGAIRATRVPDNPLYDLRAWLVPPPVPEDAEARWLARTYGPQRQSQGFEEWIVRDFFKDRRDGTFVDIGASDYRVFNNTWYLEHHLGWSGVAVDALAEYRAGYEDNRPRTKFFNFYVSDRSADNATIFIGDQKLVTSSAQEFTKRYGDVNASVEVPTISLTDLLDRLGIGRFDFLSMDIELAEPKALAGFDIERFRPGLVCVEAHPEVRQQILDYFAKHGYVVAGKYLRVDPTNVWFIPAGTPVSSFPFQALPH